MVFLQVLPIVSNPSPNSTPCKFINDGASSLRALLETLRRRRRAEKKVVFHFLLFVFGKFAACR